MATASTINGEIANRIRGAADAANVPLTDVALGAGMAERSFFRYLTGNTDWKVVQVAKIADALDVDLIDLLIGRAA